MKELTDFDIWWFEQGKELFKQSGALGDSARYAAKTVARASWNYAQSLKQETAA